MTRFFSILLRVVAYPGEVAFRLLKRLRPPRVYVYMLAYTADFPFRGAATGRCFMTVDRPIDSQEQVEAVEAVAMQNNGARTLFATNLVLLSRRFGRVPNAVDIPFAPKTAEPEKEAA